MVGLFCFNEEIIYEQTVTHRDSEIRKTSGRIT